MDPVRIWPDIKSLDPVWILPDLDPVTFLAYAGTHGATQERLGRLSCPG